MFFLVLTSHVVGTPFIAETMLRSGVPPHIGHSFPPGSEKADVVKAPAATPRARSTALPVLEVGSRPWKVESWEFGVGITLLLIPIDLDVVVIKLRAAGGVRWSVRIDAGAALEVADRIDPFDGPRGGFRLPLRPHLAARTDAALIEVLDLEFHRVPLVFLPGELDARDSRLFGLPRLQLDALVRSPKDQLVTLGDDSNISHLAPLFQGSNVSFHRDVGEIGGPEKRPRPLGEGERILRQLDEDLIPFEVADRELAGRVHPVGRRYFSRILEVERPRQIRNHAHP